ncbi:extracellular solute-binding protein [Demequina capsici]|uniref:Extracellular solute-binding protein n=1 Tax=Demequina capsici TaxID=3075620 RepID=A0AA96F601_9MICO|nr:MULTISPECIES: extracellular solute-binding protein [unclassified Demequina]WNM24741.1 extracellular solute-binding protein [Demequina sp. OYTSA14]WNM27650.1 extracellular solute-binding protein [Demequina sp. PMTSA13]
MKRRTAAAAGILAVGALALTACSSGGDEPAASGSSGSGDYAGQTLTVMHYEGEDSAMGIAWNKAIDIFEQETGATVNLQTTAFEDLNSSAEQLFDSSDAPDVSEYNKGNGTAGQLASIGVIQNLDKYYDEYGWGDKLASGIDTIAKYDENGVMGSGDWYGVPNYGEFVFLYYNKDMFDQYGLTVPTTMDELESDMQTFVDNGITPLTTSAQEYPMGQLWYQLALSQADRQWVNDYQLYQNPVDWTGKEVTYASSTLQDWISKGYISKDVSGMTAEDAGLQFINGESPMFYSGSWWYGRMLSDITDFNFGITNWPETTLTPGSGGNIWVIPAQSKNPDLAAKFIDITMSPEVQNLLGDSGGLPVAADASQITDPDAQTLISLFNEVNDKDGLSFYPDWPTPDFYGDLNSVMQGLVNGTYDATSANAQLGTYYEDYVSTVQ